MIAAILAGIVGLLVGVVVGFLVGAITGLQVAREREGSEVKEARRVLARRRVLQRFQRESAEDMVQEVDQALTDLARKGLRN